MSDAAVIAPDTAPAAPIVTTPVPAADSAVTPQPVVPPTATAARESLFTRPAQASAGNARDALDTPLPARDPATGQFVGQPGSPDPAAVVSSTPAAEPVADPAAPPAAVDPAPASVREGFVAIDLPEGHPLRAKGRESLLAPKEDEAYFRWAVNNAIRRDDVARYHDYAQQVERQNIELQAKLRAYESFSEEAVSDPKIAYMLQDVERAYGPEYAAAMRRALLAEKVEAKAQQFKTELETGRAEADAEAIAGQFVNQAYGEAVQRFPLWTVNDFDEALAAYGAAMEARGVTTPDLGGFLRYANSLYLQNPEVVAQLSAQRDREEQQRLETVRLEERNRLAEEERRKIEAAANARRDLPFARVASAAGENGMQAAVPAPAPTAAAARQSLFRRHRA